MVFGRLQIAYGFGTTVLAGNNASAAAGCSFVRAFFRVFSRVASQRERVYKNCFGLFFFFFCYYYYYIISSLRTDRKTNVPQILQRVKLTRRFIGD